MAIYIEMPKLSDTMTEGTVIRWLKQLGDQVEIGDEIAEIETDKATMVMEAFDEGTLSEVLIPEGGKADVGSTLAVLDDGGDDSADAPEQAAAPTPAPVTSVPTPDPAPPVETVPVASPSSAPVPVATATQISGARIKASPLARKIAAANGLALEGLQGSGPGGRVVKKDVEAALASPAMPTQAAPSAGPPAAAVAPVVNQGDRKVELSSMRRIIAERLLTSKTTIPHFYLHVEANAGPLMDIRRQVNAQAEASHGNKYTVNDFILKAVINAMQAVPAVNASFNGDHIVQFGQIGIAVAVAVDDGLVTPVLKDAAAKSLLQISREVKEMAGRARENKLHPSEFDGGTLTVSNLGAYGVESFDAIINPPQAAILAVGAIVEKPVVENGEVVPGLRMDLGLSCDHRVVDGAVGAQFLAQLKKLIENPALMLV